MRQKIKWLLKLRYLELKNPNSIFNGYTSVSNTLCNTMLSILKVSQVLKSQRRSNFPKLYNEAYLVYNWNVLLSFKTFTKEALFSIFSNLLNILLHKNKTPSLLLTFSFLQVRFRSVRIWEKHVLVCKQKKFFKA